MTGKQVGSKVNIKESEILDDDDSDDDEEGVSLKKQFTAFVQFKSPDNPGTHILLSQSDFWMKHAGVIQETLAAYKKIPVDEIIRKLRTCGPPPPEIQIINFPATP